MLDEVMIMSQCRAPRFQALCTNYTALVQNIYCSVDKIMNMMSRARILMQKHIFSMWAESKDASKSEEFSMKGVSMQKL